eukprot:12895137-Alexandrium_andersonii.AAC.1
MGTEHGGQFGPLARLRPQPVPAGFVCHRLNFSQGVVQGCSCFDRMFMAYANSSAPTAAHTL